MQIDSSQQRRVLSVLCKGVAGDSSRITSTSLKVTLRQGRRRETSYLIFRTTRRDADQSASDYLVASASPNRLRSKIPGASNLLVLS